MRQALRPRAKNVIAMSIIAMNRDIRFESALWGLFLAGAILVPATLAAEDSAQGLSPVELVRQAVYNEVTANSNPGSRFMFRNQRKTAHLDQVKLLVETKDAIAGMVIANDGHPLPAEERKREEARLANYVQNPEALSRKRKQEKDEADHTLSILKALPTAFLYEPDGAEKGSDSVGRAGDELVRFKFRSNPAYRPPSRVEQVLTGMSGTLIVDATQKRIAEIDGTLQQEVGFGWGILGHLDRGGRFLVQQADVGGQQWEVKHMELKFTGKILMMKKISIQSTDTFSDFRSVPLDLTFAQGVELLKKSADQANAGMNASPVASSNASAKKEIARGLEADADNR
jgi:hypothetical protein